MSRALGLLLLSLLNHSSGVHSLATLTQPASQSVSLGGTVKLSCSGSSDGGWVTAFPWYQQKPGQAPRFVHCDGCSDRGEGIPDRFSVSYSGTTGYLTITNIQPEDEAVYYCADWDLTGAWSQPTITQATSMSASLGQTVKLSCSRSSGGNWESYRWYQHTPGEPPCFLNVNDACNRGKGTPNRFTVSNSGTTGYLTIKDVQPGDEADYYCANWYSTGYMCHIDAV